MHPQFMAYGALFLAIISETIATSFLKQSEQFTKLGPSLICIAGYATSFYLLSICLKTMPIGIAYAIWSAFGIVLISLIARFVFHQHLDFAAWAGITMIIAGVVVINLFSNSITH